jgi:RHS repeat-associated protein
MTKWKKSLGFMVAAEFTVAGHMLLFLPPAAQAATPVPVEAKISGEAALAMLEVETAAPAPQEPVTVNKTVPNVEPPPQYPTFSPVPTDEELTKARLFGEPLIPQAGESNDVENQALAQAITTYLYGGDSEALEPLEGVVTAFPRSRWRVAVQANVGSWYRKKGYFTRAQRNLTEAWQLGKSSDTEGVRKLAEFAAGELMQIHMQFGQVDPLEALVAEFEGRELSGGITETLAAARATVWGLRNDHGSAIPSGSVALERIRKDKHEKAERQKQDQDPNYRSKAFERNESLDAFPATHDGASLADIQDLADLTDLELQMAKRQNPAAVIPVPSLVHLKQGHFAALVEERDGRFRFNDPLLGGEVWMSREAFEEEISGFFLLEQGRLPDGWRSATRGEAEPVRGKCVYAYWGLGGNKKNDVSGASCPRGAGMAWFTFHTMLASLSIVDSPVGYAPPLGPSAHFVVTYNQREAGQPSTFYFSNLGARWSHNWLSYIEDDPTNVGDPIVLYAAGGGYEDYNGFENDVSAPQQDTRAVVSIISTSPIIYERQFSDGSKEIFAQSDGAGVSPRRVFLIEKHDAQGNKITLTYDSDLRLVSVTDTIDQVTSFSYDLASDPLKITKVTDPFERTAKFEYNNDGQLVRITDAIGLTSEFEYGSADFIRGLTTAYGRTTFRHGVGPYNTLTNRWLEATDPLGGTQRVERLLNAAPLATSDSVGTVPTGFSGNLGLNTHVSVYYSKLQMDREATDPPDPAHGTITRWRSADSFTVSGYQIQSIKQPLESRVWYEHVAETFTNGTGADGRPAMTGRVLDNGTSQINRYEYNHRGRTTRHVDPLGREKIYEYDNNDFDLVRVKTKSVQSEVVVAAHTYNSQHLPLVSTNAANQETAYAYNALGQLETITLPERDGIIEDRTITYTYDSEAGRLAGSSEPGGRTFSYSYDSYGRIQTTTDFEGYSLNFDYDSLDRLVKVTYPDETTEEWQYERLDSAREKDRLGRWSLSIYDALRRLIATQDPSGKQVEWGYCECGTLNRIIGPNGTSTVREYDLQGRLSKEIRADDSFTEYEYDSLGRIAKVTDAKDQETHYLYSLDNALLGLSYSNEEVSTTDVTFSYADPSTGLLDPHGRVRQVTDGIGTTVYTYHPPGQLGALLLESVDGPLSNDTVSYDYDARGRVVARTLGTTTTAWNYDNQGRLRAITDPIGTFEFKYDGASNRFAFIRYPNGQTSTYKYFAAADDYQLQQIHHRSPDGSNLNKFDFVFDQASVRLESFTEQQGDEPATVNSLEYDASDQLVASTIETVAPVPVLVARYRYAYDLAGNRTAEQIDDSVSQFTYNALNRLVGQSAGGTMNFRGTLSEPSSVAIAGLSATVDSSSQFNGVVSIPAGTSSIEVAATDASDNTRTNTYEVSSSGASMTMTHDLAGNLTTAADGTDTRTYEWDAAHRLVRAKQNGTEIARYDYNAAGQRVQKTIGTTTVSYLYDGDDIIEERTSPSETARYVYGPVVDRPLAVVRDQSVHYFVADHLGSVRRETDSAGQPTLSREYDPYGNLLSAENVGGYAFTGREWDVETQLYYYRARYYDPGLGRFVSEDPAGVEFGPNLYAYVRNRPTTLVDPQGLMDLNLFEEGTEEYIVAQRESVRGMYTVAGHGIYPSNTSGAWGVSDQRASFASLREADLAEIISNDGRWKFQDVRLYVCNTGLSRDYLDDKIYAKELAIQLCVTVEAPTGLIKFTDLSKYHPSNPNYTPTQKNEITGREKFKEFRP